MEQMQIFAASGALGALLVCDRDGVKEGRDSHFGSVKG